MTPAHTRPVIAIGALHIDTIAHAREPIRPETSTPARLASQPGGVATNLARALARLDTPVRLVGTVGDDSAAELLTRRLTGEGILLSVLPRPGFATGQYLALHDPSGALAAACVDDRVLAEAPADLFDDLVTGLVSTPADDTIWFADANLPEAMLVRLAGRIGPGRLIASAVSEAKSARLKPVLTALDCLMLNRGEAAALTGLPPDAAAQHLADALAQTGLHSFVMTCGAQDVHVLEAGTIRTFAPPKTGPETGIIDVTGAGDALIAGMIAARARSHGLSDAVPFGLAAAALTLASTGALAETLSWDALRHV
ncbi:PfkB family carbohydrate kinase [Roseibium sp. AS2]|uniref:PfkB family carbohydrate kinase n=1 Tax=Roseibium sp. AS2 TaxID=3135781 RepID=UPI00317C2739